MKFTIEELKMISWWADEASERHIYDSDDEMLKNKIDDYIKQKEEENKPRYQAMKNKDEWVIQVFTKEFGCTWLLESHSNLPIAMSFESEEDANSYINLMFNKSEGGE